MCHKLQWLYHSFLLTASLLLIAPNSFSRNYAEASERQFSSSRTQSPSSAGSTKTPKVRRPYEAILFQPMKFPFGNWKPKGLKFEDVWFKAKDGTKLHGWYCRCKKPRAVVLYAHGNAGNLSHRSALLKFMQGKLRVSVLIFDYRGYGRSGGVPTVDGVLQDAHAARKFLAGHAKIKESDIVLMGRSLGGAVAVQLAADKGKGARGLILESTFSSLRDAANIHFPQLSWMVPANKLNSAAQISKYKGPLLQSHGNRDRTIPYALGQKLYRSANKPKQFVTIPGGNHNSPQTREYYQQLDRFIGNLSKAKKK